jgi:hypothetical protein
LPSANASPVPITRNPDGSLHYDAQGMEALLRKLVARTGGLAPKRTDPIQIHIRANPAGSSPKDTFIPDADMVALSAKKDIPVDDPKNGLIDPYLTGLVAGEKETKVDPKQYTVFQEDKAEEADPSKMGEALRQYGGTDKEGHEPRLRDLVVFKPERMALHWTAMLTSFFVRTDVEMPKKQVDEEGVEKDPTTGDFALWMEKRDKDYVNKVNEIYYKLFAVDRTLDKRFENRTPPSPTWRGAVARMREIRTICESQKSLVHEAVAVFAANPASSALANDVLTILSFSAMRI